MDRSRSKRYYYDNHHQDYDIEPRTKQRYSTSSTNHYSGGSHHRHRSPAVGGGGGGRKGQDGNLMVTTSYRILCHDIKAGGVIGKSGSIIKAIRQHTGAWINVHELIPGDEERIIEISDTRRRDPDGRMPSFSPAQEALLLIQERILESEGGRYNAGFGNDEEDNYGGPRGAANKMVTRLVVSRMHVGCLLGKGGKIIEQMRKETNTHIRVLPRDHTIPHCVAMSEEIVQVVGELNSVKNAVAIISSRLRESQHRDRSHFQGRQHSPERFFPPEDDFVHHMGNMPRRTPFDGAFSVPRLPARSHSSRQPSFAYESGTGPLSENAQSSPYEDIVFRILCPVNRIDSVVGESNGILELLNHEVGVDVKVADLVAGSNEQVIVIVSDEGPDHELFPAQEALLHIQTRIVDLDLEKEQNFVTTRLVLSSSEIGCLGGKDGVLSEIKRTTGTEVQILPREEVPVCLTANDELLQIDGEIRGAREAIMEVTERLRSYLYQGLFQKATSPPSFSATSSLETATSSPRPPPVEPLAGNDIPVVSFQQSALPLKDSVGFASGPVKQNESESRQDVPSGLNRIAVPLVTRSTLEVIIPQYAVSKLIANSKNKLAQISGISGANIQLLEDRLDSTENVIQISGTPEQAERAQSLLQGFILSTQEDS